MDEGMFWILTLTSRLTYCRVVGAEFASRNGCYGLDYVKIDTTQHKQEGFQHRYTIGRHLTVCVCQQGLASKITMRNCFCVDPHTHKTSTRKMSTQARIYNTVQIRVVNALQATKARSHHGMKPTHK